MLSKEDLSNRYEYPAYSAESTNNGIIGYTKHPEFICDKEHPIYITFGDHTRTFNIAKKSFSVLDNVKVLLPIINNYRSLLWIITAWQKEIPNLGYARHWKIAKNCIIQLPTKCGQIDFEFMESFVAELETRRVAELETYLLATGLKDYVLTVEEENIIKNYQDGKIVLSQYLFKDIFNNIKQGRRLKKDDQEKGNIPFVMSGTTNTGIVGYISNPIVVFPKNSITIDIFGNAFYRNFEFGAGDDTGAYWNTKIDYSKEEMLFFAASIGRALSGRFSYGKKLRSSQSYNFKMYVIDKDDKPDFESMKIFISAIQKLVIKDVVLYADSKIKEQRV